MPRAKGGYKTRRRRKNILALAKGFRGRRRTVYNIARPTVERALCYAYRDRRRKKRDMRRLWITRLSAAAKLNNTSYSKLMGNLKKAGIDLNRKVLSEMAINAPEAFTELVKSITK
ncbi:50S ribosomal protein L20 [Mucispirillum schaedleri]|uniref:Large ribosomal subunit protein bL20 n=1 Tax=Mucispirillum schaedleri ASF457 TaxID=1379858 RepID=V2PWQ1_9BACT|nr:50S ribosomal protein L20 [Mucispirillum schaedleri]MCX4361346.1 50S ribosomal protein L20 [Mucispirillum schaedleri]USF24819.1 50S ribosomal protein L20 [Mucispirillum schaedleri ASF457]SIW05594.1 50S ribosomal subunit protein L20 [Mucispirillum schaedleri ASF457]